MAFKTWQLTDEHFFLQIPIEKHIFHIHLIKLKVHIEWKGIENPNSLHYGNRDKYLILVDAFFLIVQLYHQSSLVRCDCDLAIMRISKISLRSYNYSIICPGFRCHTLFISKLMMILLHIHNLVSFSKSLLDVFRVDYRPGSREVYHISNFCYVIISESIAVRT